ncbi:MAG TPA: hypothetical protein VNL35_07810 [Chloroflexota bacterium]|nr:hypothetical protein [Chloroflexota bacterium]
MISFQIEPAVSAGKAVLRVRCSDQQLIVLKRLLAGAFSGQAPPLVRELDQTQFTHRCVVPEPEASLRGRWAGWQIELLLAAAPKEITPATTRPAPHADPTTTRMSRERSAASEPLGAEGGSTEVGSTAPTRSPTPPGGKPGWAIRPTRVVPDPLERRLLHLSSLSAPERLAGLEELAASFAGGPVPEAVEMMRARAANEAGDYQRAVAAYEELIPRLSMSDQVNARAELVEVLLLASQPARVVAWIPDDETEPHLRGLLGVALDRLGRDGEGLAHLAYSWETPSARSPLVARALARVYWRREAYEAAAPPYSYLFDHALQDLDADDYLAMAELAEIGAFGKGADTYQLTCIELFAASATPAARAEENAQRMIRAGLELARRQGDPSRLFRAYQQVLDDLSRRRSETGGEVVDLLDHIAADHHGGRIAGSSRFDLVEEVLEYLKDYPTSLRPPLIATLEDLLETEVAASTRLGSPFPSYVKDLGRVLHRLRSRSPIFEVYKHALAARQAPEPAAGGDEAPPGIAGKRVALVGGHDRTRLHVKALLHDWGAAVDEVPPPTAGRISEREVLDRVHSSDLIVLIVSYMGHDMSTIVSNLKQREAVRGKVLPVECRGVSGVCRAIRDWAEGVAR